MKIIIDTETKKITVEQLSENKSMPLFSRDAFELISDQWIKIGWNEKYSYTFTWMGRPIIQLPEDIIRIQEVIYKIKPDVIIEAGIAHGGSLIFYASLCKAMGKGRVIGVDIDIRPHNRTAIESHELFPVITLIEGSSTNPRIVRDVKRLIKPEETVFVVLDSNHTKQHVLEELESYHDVVTQGSYIVVTDGNMKDLHDTPRGKPEWVYDNPYEAAKEFAMKHAEFEIETPPWPFNESELSKNVTQWPGAWLKKSR